MNTINRSIKKCQKEPKKDVLLFSSKVSSLSKHVCYTADEFAANTKCRLLFANPVGRPLSPSLLSGHGREVVVGGESLDRFRCPAPSDCRPGTAPQVWSCCTLANPLARRRGPRWSPRRPAQGAAAVRCVLCARLQLLHFLLKRECSDLVRDDGEYAAAVDGPALCSGGGWTAGTGTQHSALKTQDIEHC